MACIRLPHHRRDGYVQVHALMVGSTRRLMVLAGIITLTILRRYLNSAEDEAPSESPKRFERQVTRALHRCYSGSAESVLVQTMYRDGELADRRYPWPSFLIRCCTGIHFYFIFLGTSPSMRITPGASDL